MYECIRKLDTKLLRLGAKRLDLGAKRLDTELFFRESSSRGNAGDDYHSTQRAGHVYRG